jgi:choline dehydrogenase
VSDYVIVGAGTAGCVLAARMSATGAEVTVLEGGPDDRRPEIRVPSAYPLLFGTECDYAYTTRPQPGLNNRQLYWPRGRVLGGCSAINAQIWTRGHPADFDEWQAAGWSAAELGPVLRQAERGPMRLAQLRRPHRSTEAFQQACTSAGLTAVDPKDVSVRAGHGPARVIQWHGRRWSAADAYLRPVLRRPNLTVITRADARRVLIRGGRATGVEYLASDGTLCRVPARCEVLVAAGAVGSPALLLRSGIGDPEQVGANLQDHLMVPLVFGGGTEADQPDVCSNNAEAMAFLPAGAGELAHDLELLWMPVPFLDHARVPRHQGKRGCTLAVVLLRPGSSGRITATGQGEEIDPGYLTDSRDLETLLEGVRFAHRLVAGSPLAGWIGEPLNEAAREATAPAIRASAETLYHPMGTCAIGKVVDEQLRVKGVAGLRVVDASVCPVLPRGHPLATTVAIGERAAELMTGREMHRSVLRK